MDSRISFVVPVYNGLDFTRGCLDSLRRTVDIARHEVIIVDDASTDGTREFLSSLTGPFRVVSNTSRRGYAANNNAAARLASGEILCLLNNDIVLFSGWLEPMRRALTSFPDAGVIGNVQRNPRSGRYDHLGFVFAADGTPWHYGKHFLFNPHTGYTTWRAVTAACCLIRRSLFLEVGGFDESYVNGSEDVDLCLRLGQRGYKHYVANDSVIDHYVSSSEGRHDFNAENQGRLLDKWRHYLQQSLTPRDRRLFACNYLLRNLTQPWRYDGRRLWHSALCLATLGRHTNAATTA